MAAPCHWKTGCGLCSIVIALVAICMQTLIWWRASHHGMGKPWALISSHETIRSPGTQFARYRGDERTEDNFMQWYYCMIHDSQTKQTWSFAIGTFRQVRRKLSSESKRVRIVDTDSEWCPCRTPADIQRLLPG